MVKNVYLQSVRTKSIFGMYRSFSSRVSLAHDSEIAVIPGAFSYPHQYALHHGPQIHS